MTIVVNIPGRDDVSKPSVVIRASNQGLEAVNRTAAAKGQLGSGNRLYDLTNYGQGLASQTYNSTVNQLGNFLNKTPMTQSMSNYQTNANGTTTFGGTY